jgi:hypothetical protein
MGGKAALTLFLVFQLLQLDVLWYSLGQDISCVVASAAWAAHVLTHELQQQQQQQQPHQET